MKNKTLIGIASFFLSMSVIFLLVLIFFGDRLEMIDAFLERTEEYSTVSEETTVPTTVTTTAESTEAETETAVPQTETTTLEPLARPAYSGDEEKLVAFTFDDGPSSSITLQMLDLLEMYDSRATFFVLGNTVTGKENILKRMTSIGCQIGNHSYEHKRFSEMTAEEIREDFQKSQKAIKKAAGTEPELFRVPYGENTAMIRSNIDIPLVYWSIDTLDWDKKDKPGVNRSEEERNRAIKSIYDGVINYVRPGDIVLMHDLYQITLDAFEEIILTLTQDGWKLVTVSELYEERGYELRPGVVNRCAR